MSPKNNMLTVSASCVGTATCRVITGAGAFIGPFAGEGREKAKKAAENAAASIILLANLLTFGNYLIVFLIFGQIFRISPETEASILQIFSNADLMLSSLLTS